MGPSSDYRNYRERAEDRLKTFIFILEEHERSRIVRPLRDLVKTEQIRRVFKILNLRRLRELVILMITAIAEGKDKTTTINDMIRAINKKERLRPI